MKKVGIIMGSDSDLPIIQKTVDILKSLDIPFEVHIYSAHRTPVEARDFAVNARNNDFGVLIAAAGISVAVSNLFGTTPFSINWKGLVLAALLWLLTNKVKQTKKLHPIVFIGASALVGILYSM